MTREQALELLCLPIRFTKNDLACARLDMLKESHPDGGGSTEAFRAVQQAVDILRKEEIKLPKPIRENTFQTQVVKALQQQGALVFNIWGGGMQRAGLPDLYVAHPKWTGWLELKVGRGKVSQLQKLTIERLCKAGANAYVLRNDEIEDYKGNVLATATLSNLLITLSLKP